VTRLLRYVLALMLILVVLLVLMHHTNFEGLMRKIHGG
jgi:preprotein translocase subunit SecG